MKSDRVSTKLRACLRWAPLVALLGAVPCHAQFKVVGTDGKVTYTDRQPSAGEGKVTSLGARTASASAGDVALPLELRQAAARYPVTLYTTAGACAASRSPRNRCKAPKTATRSSACPVAATRPR
jgi:hypothetical protein